MTSSASGATIMANSNLPFSRDAYDDLADLFLTEPIDRAGRADPGSDAPLRFPLEAAGKSLAPAPLSTARSPRLLAIMRVNLPVIAGPWLEQAAAAIASQAGPVVLIRERGGKACLDLVAGRDGQQAAAAALAGPPESLPAAVEQLRDVIACWVVEAPSNADSRPSDWTGFDEIVLLTGADEAATVAAFAQAKSICASVRARPTLSLVVVGSDEETARRAAGRITQACAESLDCAIELRAIVRRMQPVPMRHLGRFVQAGKLTAQIADSLNRAAGKPIRQSQGPVHSEPKQASLPVAVTIPRVVLRPRTAAPAPTQPPGPRVGPRPAQVPPAEEQTIATSVTADQPSRHPSHEPAAVTAQAVPSTPPTDLHAPRTTQPPDTLLSLLGDLRPLEIDCPRAPGVELGFDLQGRLHAMAEDDSHESLQRLFVACDWVREHRALLCRLNPWLASVAGARGTVEVTPHLFTSRPRERRHLADGALRLHILVRDAADGIVAHLELN